MQNKCSDEQDELTFDANLYNALHERHMQTLRNFTELVQLQTAQRQQYDALLACAKRMYALMDLHMEDGEWRLDVLDEVRNIE